MVGLLLTDTGMLRGKCCLASLVALAVVILSITVSFARIFVHFGVFFIEGTSNDPLIRWGLLHPSKNQYHVVACIFSGYHAVRNDLRNNPVFIPHNETVLNSPLLRRSWSVFADSFKVEARELTVQHRRFSLPEFLIFIQ